MSRWAPRVRQPFAFVRQASLRCPRRRLLPLGVAALIACPAALAAAGDGGKPIPHLRSADRQILAMLREGCRRSPTLKRLADGIEHSDVIVYFEATHEVPHSMQAYLQLAGAGPTLRFLRIAVKIPASTDTLIAQMGHELQHATEIARATEVRDQAGMEALYHRIGGEGDAGWETAAARLVGATILDELRHPDRTLRADTQPAGTQRVDASGRGGR